jgi:hypothetical protein
VAYGSRARAYAPKFAPGQVEDDPDHGFRVCVNALINKCLKPNASTIPLATDEIKELGGHGNQLRDGEGNLKTLRHRFAVYCDDIAAGADTLEELYELFEALICCCHKAGIQIKAAKVKFGVRKEANLCGIRNMSEPKDIHQVRAFLGCCQQLKHYIKDYGIIAKPLHDITKKGAKGPPPWIKGTAYDLAFVRLKVLILDGRLYVHHKDKGKSSLKSTLVMLDGEHALIR